MMLHAKYQYIQASSSLYSLAKVFFKDNLTLPYRVSVTTMANDICMS